MTKVGVIGDGRLGSVIIEAINSGKAPGCELVGVASLNTSIGVRDLVDLGAEYILEASTQPLLKEHLLYLLEHGVNVIPLSAGALNDDVFRAQVEAACREHHCKVILPHGVLGAFDLAATFALMPGMKSTVVQASKTGANHSPMGNMPDHFLGTVREGYAMNPSHLNSVIEAGLVSGGFDQAMYERRTVEEGSGYWEFNMESEYSSATLHIQGRGSENDRPLYVIALSAVAALNRALSPITY